MVDGGTKLDKFKYAKIPVSSYEYASYNVAHLYNI